ncbi:MAG: NTP transferase domain-containing protein [Candidatus Bathyarchaeia archaeon]|jgi:adenosylcobinamide-phosphate guanylyltransferase
MDVTALVMAGGKATRMASEFEKPLVEVGGKPMLVLVVEALKKSKNIGRIVVAVSPNTPKTALVAREIGAEVMKTQGLGYEEDMKFAIKQRKLRDVMVVSADLPLLTPVLIDRAIESYRREMKPALSVMAHAEIVEKQGAKPSFVFQVGGTQMVPIGINLIDGTRIDEPELEETILIAEPDDSILNVNTIEELKVARELKANEQRSRSRER